MRVLVTGSSGFLGLHLLKNLSVSNMQVLAIYNKTKPKNSYSKNIIFLKKI